MQIECNTNFKTIKNWRCFAASDVGSCFRLARIHTLQWCTSTIFRTRRICTPKKLFCAACCSLHQRSSDDSKVFLRSQSFQQWAKVTSGTTWTPSWRSKSSKRHRQRSPSCHLRQWKRNASTTGWRMSTTPRRPVNQPPSQAKRQKLSVLGENDKVLQKSSRQVGKIAFFVRVFHTRAIARLHFSRTPSQLCNLHCSFFRVPSRDAWKLSEKLFCCFPIVWLFLCWSDFHYAGINFSLLHLKLFLLFCSKTVIDSSQTLQPPVKPKKQVSIERKKKKLIAGGKEKGGKLCRRGRSEEEEHERRILATRKFSRRSKLKRKRRRNEPLYFGPLVECKWVLLSLSCCVALFIHFRHRPVSRSMRCSKVHQLEQTCVFLQAKEKLFS